MMAVRLLDHSHSKRTQNCEPLSPEPSQINYIVTNVVLDITLWIYYHSSSTNTGAINMTIGYVIPWTIGNAERNNIFSSFSRTLNMNCKLAMNL